MFCEKPPKGFEKYFKQGGAKVPKEPVKDGKISKEAKEGKEKETQSEPIKEAPKRVPPSTSSGSGIGGSKPYEQWSFGLFGGTGRG